VSAPLRRARTQWDAKGAVPDLTLGECKTDAGDEAVSGSLKSSQDATADFLVTVSWTTAAKVAAGATQCVKGVEYGTISG
jgi:hypothetical protein